MLCHLGCSFCLRVCVLIVDVWNRGPLCLKVHSSSFSYVAQGCMPKSKELLFLCRNVGTGQRSALLYSLCLSSHLSPSLFFFFCFFLESLPSFPPSASIVSLSILCLLIPPLLCFLTMLFRLPLLSSFFSLIFLSPLVISIHAFFSHTSLNLTSFPPLCPCVFSPPVHSSSYRPPLSVPAGGRGPLGAATVAQGQLLAGGDEAG